MGIHYLLGWVNPFQVSVFQCHTRTLYDLNYHQQMYVKLQSSEENMTSSFSTKNLFQAMLFLEKQLTYCTLFLWDTDSFFPILICLLKNRQKKIDGFTLKVYAFPLWPMNQFPFHICRILIKLFFHQTWNLSV